MKTKEEFLNNVYEKYEKAVIDENKEENIKDNIKRKRAYKYIGSVAACLVIGIGLISINGGLFRAGSAMDSAATTDLAYYNTGENTYISDESAQEEPKSAAYDGVVAEYEEDLYEIPASGIQDDEAVNGADSNPGKELKLIYRADMSVQTTDFDKAVSDLEALVSKNEGYFESKEIYNGGYYSNGEYISGYYVVRVPQKNYNNLINSVGETCYVVSKSESVEDVGQAYYDIESHIKTLQIKEERLQELLKKASKMSDIIEIESALSETEHELESYKSDLDRYDSLIDYSTVTINIDKVTQYAEQVDVKTGFFGRIWRSIRNGVLNFGSKFTDFLAWLGYNLLPIITFFVIIFVIIRFDIFGRIGSLFERIRFQSHKNRK